MAGPVRRRPPGLRVSLTTLRSSGSAYYAPRRGRQRFAVIRNNWKQLTSELNKLRKAQMPGNPNWGVAGVVAGMTFPNYRHNFYFSGGWIGLDYARELTKPEIAVGKRIANAFDVAYCRFVELQQKEQRARDAEIEAALERVRARALGMQEGGEVMGVATVLRNEFEDLGLPVSEVHIVLDDEPAKVIHAWIAHPLTPREVDFIPARTRRLDRRRGWYRRWKQGERYWTSTHAKTELARIVRDLGRFHGLPWQQTRRRIAAMPDPVHVVNVSFSHGLVVLGAAAPFSEDDTEVAGRFVDVFALAYRRFRELTIQNALERVRARALGMQESADIGTVTEVLCQEQRRLGLDPLHAIIGLDEGDTIHEFICIDFLDPDGVQ